MTFQGRDITMNPTSTTRRSVDIESFSVAESRLRDLKGDILWKFCAENQIEWAYSRPAVILGVVKDNALMNVPHVADRLDYNSGSS